MKKVIALLCSVVVMMIITTSCDSNDNYEMKYAPMKLVDSKMWSIVDVQTGEIIYKDEFTHEPSLIVNDMFYVQNDEGLYDVYNMSNVKKPINKEAYKYISAFDMDGEAVAVMPGGGIILINNKCKVLKEFSKDIKECSTFSKNGTAVYSDATGKSGLINKDGQVIIKAKYDFIHNSSNDDEIVAATKENQITKYEIIDKKQNVSFSFTSKDYEEIGYFSDGLLSVKKADGSKEVIFIDKKGNKTSKFGIAEEYGMYKYSFVDGIVPFMEGKSYGIKNKDGEILIRAKYESIVIYEKNIILAKKNDKWGIINEKDEIRLPFEYKGLSYLTKDRFITGEFYSSDNDNPFSIIDSSGKDIGTNNFKEINVYGTYVVKSNFFDAKSEANKLTSMFTNNSCNNITAGKTLKDFKHLLTYSEYYYKGDYTLGEDEKIGDVSVTYGFDSSIARETYEYIYGYRFSNGTKFNYNAKCIAVFLNYSLAEFPITSEEQLVQEIEKVLKEKGFNKSDKENYFTNANGINIGVGYSKGEIIVAYFFNDKLRIDIERNPRTISDIMPKDKDYDVLDTTAVVDTVLIE